MTKISEDIHWLILINGFILFEINTVESEEALISDQIMSYSIKISPLIDYNFLNKLISSINEPTHVHNQPSYPILNTINLGLIDTKIPHTLDPILSFIFSTFQLGEIENQMLS